MRTLLLSIFLITLMGMILIPNAFGITQIVKIPIGASSGDHFDPSIIEIKKDDTVKWANLDRNTAHTVTSTSTNWTVDSGDLLPNNDENYCYPNCKPSFSYTFDAGGTYNYECKIHSWMKGVVKVIELGQDAEIKIQGYAGDMYIDKSQYEVIVDDNVEIKIYGEVKNPKASDSINFTITKPNGNISEQKIYRTGEGYYQLILSVNYEDSGTYNIVSTFGLENIGTANFVVVERPSPTIENPFPSSDDESTNVSGSSQNNQENTLTVSTHVQSYKKGDMIKIAGKVSWFDDPRLQLTLQVFDPINHIVAVSQMSPNNDGTYSMSINSNGPMFRASGDYTVKVKYGTWDASTKFFLTMPPTFNSPSSATSTSPTSTLLILNSLDSTLYTTEQDPSGDPAARIFVSGKLTTTDRQYVITDAEISFMPTGFRWGSTPVTTITDQTGKFETSWTLPVSDSYGVSAVFDGTSDFRSSQSNTEYFEVRTSSQSQSTQSEDNSYAGIVGLLIIAVVIVGIVIGITRARKKRTVTVSAGRGTAGTATITKASKPRKTPRAGKAPLLMGKIRQAKRAVGRQSPKAKSKIDTMHYFRCKKCHLEEFLENEADGQQYCTKCGWKKW